MRYLSTLFGVLCLACMLAGQSVGEQYFSLKYQIPPTAQVSPDYTTYSTRVYRGRASLPDLGLTETELTDRLRLRNFKKVDINGHLRVTYNLGRFDMGVGETKSQTTETKKKDGTVVKTTTYWQELPYSFPISMRVVDPDGAVVHEAVVGSRSAIYRFPERGSGYKSNTTLLTELRKQLAANTKKLQSKLIDEAVSGLNEGLRTKIDVRSGADRLYFEFPKGKKAENADAWATSATTAVEIIAQLSPDAALPADLRQQFEAQTGFWSTQLDNYDPGDKKQQRYYHSAAFNLAMVEFVLENFPASQERATALENAVKWNRDRSRNLSRKAADAQRSLENYPQGSRHYPLRDLVSAAPPENPDYGDPVAVAAAPVTYDTLSGHVLNVDGERIAGTFVKRSGRSTRFYGNGRLQFFDSNGTALEVSPETLDEIHAGNEKFVVRSYGDRIMAKKRPHFFRVVEEGPKLSILSPLQFYEEGSVDDNYMLEVSGDDNLISLDWGNPRWLNWKKAFGEFFTDCEVLYAEIRVGEYDNSIRDIRKVVRMYNNNDCD